MTVMLRKRIRSSISVLYHELYCIACCLLGRVKVLLFFDKQRVNKLEIGASSNRNGFLTLDLDLRSPFPYDLTAGLPFPDESIDFIYAEHVLEHFQHSEVSVLLRQCLRVMKPGAVLSVCVPDAGIFLKAYVEPECFDAEKYCGHHASLNYAASINYVNYMFYMEGYHRYMFDQENLLLALQDAGFDRVRSRGFDPALDQEARSHESIYAQCLKGRVEQ